MRESINQTFRTTCTILHDKSIASGTDLPYVSNLTPLCPICTKPSEACMIYYYISGREQIQKTFCHSSQSSHRHCLLFSEHLMGDGAVTPQCSEFNVQTLRDLAIEEQKSPYSKNDSPAWPIIKKTSKARQWSTLSVCDPRGRLVSVSRETWNTRIIRLSQNVPVEADRFILFAIFFFSALKARLLCES